MRATDLSPALPITQSDLPHVPGCYVLVVDADALLELGLQAASYPAPIYVGKAEDSISKRVSGTHLIENRTGSSTLRRSIGALLRNDLSLNPRPRSPKRSEKDITNYKFDSAGEKRLSAWIAAKVRVRGVPSPSPASTEEQLIDALCPPLNLLGWANPDARMIKGKRRECADLAREAV